MKYKLYYANEYGQIGYPTGELFDRTKNDEEYFEVFDDLESAKSKGNKFLEKYPLWTCVIYSGDNEEVTLSATKEKIKIAWDERNLEQAVARQKKKNDIMFRMVLFFSVSVAIALIALFQ